MYVAHHQVQEAILPDRHNKEQLPNGDTSKSDFSRDRNQRQSERLDLMGGINNHVAVSHLLLPHRLRSAATFLPICRIAMSSTLMKGRVLT